MVVPEKRYSSKGVHAARAVPRRPDCAFVMVLGGDCLAQVLDVAVDQAGASAVRQRGQGGDRGVQAWSLS